MITLRFGLRGDMRSKAYTNPTLDSQLGAVTSILSHTRTTVTAGTVKGGSVVLAGKFKFSSENSLRDSDVTGVSLFDKGKHLLVSVSGASHATLDDLDRQHTPQLMVTFLLRDAGQGIVIQGSPFADFLIGYGADDQLFGNVGDDVLRGGAGRDTLNGGSGADRLDGGLGRDVMIGGAGNDIYIVDATADQTVENANGGVDSVQSSATWAMGAQVENLTLVGSHSIDATGNASDNHLLGNSAANTLRGAAGDDRLDGGRGADRLEGGRGNDLFIVDNRHDVVVEAAGQGTDTVQSTVSYSLPANVERLTLLGSGDIDGTGNALANVLRGNGGDNTLSGGAGHDILLPGHGHDRLTGGAGADDFVVTGARGDTLVITDLLSGTDHLWLMDSAVAALDHGPLAADNLRASGVIPDGNDFLVYNQASGVLSYDASGNGGSLFTLASLRAHTVLLADDISVGLPLI